MGRKIISNPYDSDSDVSFVHQYGTKKCAIKSPTLLDNLSNNATDLQTFGQKIALRANHAIQTFVASDADGSDEYDSDCDSRQRARRARRKAMNLILDKASLCAANLQNVAHEVPEACMSANPCLGLARDDDESSLDEPRRRSRKKKVSEARPHDGSLSEDVSITTDAYSTDVHSYISIESEETKSNFTIDSASVCSVDSASVPPTVELAPKLRLNKLRRRRSRFLRHRAIERAAGTDTEDEEEASFHYGGPKLQGLKKNSPAFDLFNNSEDLLFNTTHHDARDDTVPELVNTTNDDSLLNDTDEDDSPRDASNKVTLNVNAYASRILPNRPNSKSPRNTLPSSNLKWQAMERVIPLLSPSPNPSYNYLETSHLGPAVIMAPCKSLDEVGLQVGDVIVRINGDDVSSLEAKAVIGMIIEMAGKSLRVSYLRKNMEL
eukprot:CAMPEP_0181122860 /NCGR_PEP_ID=MMETSP1071-20121207/25552_1 /TAXON_ID=35127 /ORGANISM="Thalassiosira sp., Strain NH16" /LENGTH=435 /DNA_ID=CAMNT_0023207885 /DNA_START=106 /DNA_END=1413 /DNA_ORIENTATION=+